MKVYIYNSLIFSLRIAQEIGEDEGTAGGRSDSAAENKNILFVFNSFASLCRKPAARRDGYSLM